jgi:hypothetical protein
MKSCLVASFATHGNGVPQCPTPDLQNAIVASKR